MRKVVLVSLLLSLLFPAVSRADVYFAFSAEQLKFQGQQRVFFVPFSFVGPTHTSLERRIGVLFEKLHGSRQQIYGDAYLVVKDVGGGELHAYLTLDEGTKQFHDIILGEVYLTLANVGISKVFVGADAKPVTDAALKFPYFVPTVPLWEALPPLRFSHALVRMGENEYLESRVFYGKLDARDAALMTRITGLLKNEEPYVRLKTLEALPLLNVANETVLLLPMLKDVDDGVRYKVIDLLKDRKEAPVLDALAALADGTTDPETQLRSAKILVANGRNNFQIYILFEHLKSDDSRVVVETVGKLAASGDKRVLPAMIRMLTHEKEEVRAAAFTGLNQLQDLASLKGLLTNPQVEETFRVQVAAILMRQNLPEYSKEGINYLVTRYQGKEAVEAVTTIEMRQYKDLAPTLVIALEHLDETVAAAAVKAVGSLDMPELLPNLSKAAARPNLTQVARDTIAGVLAKRPVKDVMKLAQSTDILLREIATLSLVAAARNPQAKEVEAILDLLGEALKDKEPIIKRAAVQALNDIGGPKNWKRLLAIAADPDPAIRILAISAGKSLAGPEGDAAIVDRLSDEADDVRIAAVVAVRDRGIKDAKPRLKLLVESRNKAEKLETLRTLVGLNSNEAEHREYFETYKTLLFDMDPEMQLAAIQGIQWIVDPTVPPLLESGILLMHKEGRIRGATIVALGRSRDFNVIEFIARGFADPEVEVQKAAIEALKVLGHKKGIPPLEEFIKQTDDGELKALAQEAIDEINRPKGGLLD